MKKFEVLKAVRQALLKKGVTFEAPSSVTFGLYSVYDNEREIYNPPFTSDDISALNVFCHAVVDNPALEISLFKVGIFNSEIGDIEQFVVLEGCPNFLVVTSKLVRSVIDENGGIEE